MKASKATAGLCLLCALLVSAIGAEGAGAAGTTAYTCKPVGGTGGFLASHCRPSDISGESVGNFAHASIKPAELTEVTASDLNTGGSHTGAIFRSTTAGTPFELEAKEVSGTGSMINGVVGAEMLVSGEGTLTYSKVTENLLKCEVFGLPGGAGTVVTKELSATTQGQGDKIKVTPKAGTVLAEFELKNCAIAGLHKVIGSVIGIPDGATVSTVHNTVTAEKTLRINSAVGPVAGIAGTLTFSGRANSSQTYTPLSVTT
jgi:hypothetical protein